MNIVKSTLVITALIAGALPALAQQTKVNSTGGISPHETTSQVFDNARNNRVTITYGRPYTKDPRSGAARKIWGGLVPYGRPWRMGSDEATTLVSQKGIEIGGKTIPAGVYTLYMIPSETGTSQLVFSSALGGWGIPVDTAHDLVKVDLTKATLDKPVDQFTIAIDKNPSGGGILKLSWETTEFSVPFTIQK
jgi:hypothetical protein